ncbi:CoA transferase [Micromonospora echinaurantiaca]|uniref:CoA transferase n=1 Tax=Micromonospora echinaurantiaca TaxID=47857 RepID=UPI00378789BD
MTGPLHGLRVLELATGVAGPYAGRLLAMLGATVVKAEPPGGDPARELPVDGGPQHAPSPVFVHLNAGKRLVGRDVLPAALGWADVVLDDGTLPPVDGPPVDGPPVDGPPVDGPPVDGPPVDGPPVDGPLVVTVTSGLATDEELLVQAASGLLAVSVDDDGVPHRFPGWQSQYLAGAYAAAAALAGLARGAAGARVSWLGALLTAYEAQGAGLLYTASSGRPDDPDEARRNAGHLARTFPSGVFACADGQVIPGTVRAEDWLRQCAVYGRPDLPYDERFVWAHRWRNRHLLAAELRPWYAARTRTEIFRAALDAGWAAAMVLTARDALTDPHLAGRGFLAPLAGATGGRVAARPWRSPRLPEGVPVRLAEPGGDAAWFRPDHPRPAAAPRPPELAGLRVLELTLAWAGPLTGRFLGTLGADVVRVEVGNRPDGWRTRHRWHELGVPVPDGVDPQECTWDASAQFNSLNRGKRGISVDLATPAGADVFRDLVAVADVLVVNMTHDVLVKRGVAEDVRRQVERGLVVVTMPALGATGPYRSMAGYGMLTEGMGGFAARYGAPAEPAAVSPVYYPDAVAGVHGVLAVLAALAGRARHGRGDWLDLSQQETLWLQLGEGLVLASREGRNPARLGDAEPGVPSSGVVATRDGHVAFVDRRAGSTATPETVAGWAAGSSTAEVLTRLRAAGVAAEAVADLRRRYADGTLRTAGLVEEVDHPVAGRRAYLTPPVRLAGDPLPPARPAPLFDQHTDEVLAEWLGYDPGRIRTLRAAEAVGTRPRQPRRRSTSAAGRR